MPALELWWHSYFDYLKQILATLLVFFCLEKLIPTEKYQSLKAFGFNVLFIVTNLALIMWLIPSLSPVVQFIKEKLHAGYLTWPTPGACHPLELISFCVIYIVLWDFFQYFGHRLQHSVPFLWEIHKFHHTERALNASSSARKHIAGHIFEEFTIVLPLLLVFSNPILPYIAQFLFFNFWGYFNHMNAKIFLGPLTPVLSGPHFHRIHHSIESAHMNKNFSAFFPFIDMIFGTYYCPKGDEFPPTGVREEKDIHNLIYVNVQPFKNWFLLANPKRNPQTMPKATNE